MDLNTAAALRLWEPRARPPSGEPHRASTVSGSRRPVSRPTHNWSHMLAVWSPVYSSEPSHCYSDGPRGRRRSEVSVLRPGVVEHLNKLLDTIVCGNGDINQQGRGGGAGGFVSLISCCSWCSLAGFIFPHTLWFSTVHQLVSDQGQSSWAALRPDTCSVRSPQCLRALGHNF